MDNINSPPPLPSAPASATKRPANNTLELLRKHNKPDLVDLVKMHLSFLVEVTSEEWERIVAYVDKEIADSTDNNNTNPKAGALSALGGKNSQTKYFTSSLTSSSSSTSTNSTDHQSGSTASYKVNNKFCPPKEKELASNIFGKALTRESLRQAMLLVDYLNEDDNYKIEGIFRKSGTKERQQDLRYMLNNGVRVDLKANRFTAVDTACVLKEFIQKLPEPLLTNNHFELHFELALAIKQDTPADEIDAKNTKRLKIVQLLLHLLPEVNRTFFMSLMALLNKVALSLDVTRMDERAIATLFGQHILCPRNWTPKQVSKNIEIITDSMEFLLLNYEKLFNGPAELVMDSDKKLRKWRQTQKKLQAGDSVDGGQTADEEGDENNTVITFCQRKSSQETTTDQALAELYAQVQSMPETPQKRKLIKQFNKQNGFGTPMHVTSAGKASSSSSSKWKSLLPQMLRPKH